MGAAAYPGDRVHFHVGLVEDTLREAVPSPISILRLDTDWYESTKIAMEVLFSRLSSRGILIVDDYGTWKGSRRAVDEYLTSRGINLYLFRERGGRVTIVP